MKLDEVIAELTRIRQEHGNLPVITHDGMDPSDLVECDSIEVSDQYTFFTFKDGRVQALAVRL